MRHSIGVLDHGSVELYDSMANDLSVVNAARVSFNKRKEEVEEDDQKLINFLMRERHGTPFEHNAMIFVVKAPIFVFREWHRHRIGSFNEMSGRYTELPGEWYIPEVINVRVRVGKPGKYTYERADEYNALAYRADLTEQCQHSYHIYKQTLEADIAPELARLLLHVNHYSEMFWTVNARSLMNFLSLRNAPNAQWEIQQYAKAVEEIFMSLMPITYEAFVLNNRSAP